MRKVIKKFSKFFTVFALLLSIISSSLITNVNAVSQAGNTVNFTWGEEIYYPKWLGNWSTKMCYIDGNLAYCLEASKDTPPANASAYYVISNNEALLKVLYYGYGGPEDVFRGDTVTSDKEKYLYTHIMASYAYSGDMYGNNSWEYLESIGVGLKARWDQIHSLPIPTNTLTFNNSNDLTVSAYFDSNEKIQRTENITLNTKSDASITLPLQDNVTLHNITKGTITTSGNATVNGGDTFYLSAPLTVTENYSSDWLTANNLLKYAPLVIQGYANYQAEGTLSFVKDPQRAKLNVNWLDSTDIKINKVDNFGEKVENATFNLLEWNKTTNQYQQISTLSYDSVNKIYQSEQIVVTDSNEGKFKIEEVVPNGYTLSSKYEQEFTADGYMDRVSFTAKMQGQEVNIRISSPFFDKHQFRYEVENVPDGVTAIQFPTWSENGGQDDIEWVGLSKQSDGIWRADKRMNENGVYNVHGYFNTSSQININFFGTSVDPTDTTITVINDLIMGKVTLTKSDQDSGEKLANAQFDIIAKNDITTPQGTVKLRAGEKAVTIITDKNRYGELDNLYLGTYILKETVAPNGYHLSADQEFTLLAENQEQEIIVKNINITDKVNNLKIKKVDKDTGMSLKNAEFIIFNVSANKKIGTYTSDKNGEIDISKLSPATYYIQETKAPDAYKLNDTKYYFDINNQGNATISNMNSNVDNDTFSIDANGNMTITVKNEINLIFV